jgi:putative addiction module component (TIGR02574 family)
VGYAHHCPVSEHVLFWPFGDILEGDHFVGLSTPLTVRFYAMPQSPLPSEIRNLPVPERVALVEQIWDSIVEDESQFQLTDAQKAELDRRLAQRASSATRGAEWAEVKKRILGES